MQIIKQKILLNSNNKNLSFPLTNLNDLNGLEIGIQDYVFGETIKKINNVNDIDKYRYINTGTTNMNFLFLSGSTYFNNLNVIGFNDEEILKREENVLKSFFVMQIFNNNEFQNQSLIHTSYLNLYNLISIYSGNTNYNINNNYEFYDIYLPNNIFENISGNTINLHARFYFFNSKLNKLHLFINENLENSLNESKFFFDIYADSLNKQYYFDSNLLSIKEYNNANYNNKINQKLDSLFNNKPTFPNSKVFLETGKYLF